jgi:hypothetical protein
MVKRLVAKMLLRGPDQVPKMSEEEKDKIVQEIMDSASRSCTNSRYPFHEAIVCQ